MPFLLIALFLGGCALLRTSPGEATSFLPHAALLTPDFKRVPFAGSYYPNREKFYQEKEKYKEVVLLPINTQFVKEKIYASDDFEDVKVEHIEALEETSRYFLNRLKMAFAGYEQHPFTVVEHSSPNVDFITIELALTELVPTQTAVNFISTVAGFFVPGTGIIKSFTKGSIAFEAIIRDGLTAEILIECRDRQSDKASVFTFKDFDQFGHQRAIIDDWAEQLAQLIGTEESITIEEPLPFTFNPI